MSKTEKIDWNSFTYPAGMVQAVPARPEVRDWPPGLQRPIRITREDTAGHGARVYHGADAADVPFAVCLDPLTRRVMWGAKPSAGAIAFAGGSLPEREVRNAVLDFEGASAFSAAL